MGIPNFISEYGIKEGLVYSYPVKCFGQFKFKVVEGLEIDQFSRNKMEITEKELIQEKAEAFE